MTLAAIALDLRRNRSLLVWVGLVAFLYAGTMALFYPLIKENSALLEDYLKIFPEEMRMALGMSGSLADPGVFFTTYIGSYLWPILAAIAGAISATRPVAADLDRGFLELVVATPLPRWRYLAVSILGQAVLIILLALATLGGVIIVGALVGAGFDAGRILLVLPSATAFGWSIAAFATLLSVVTLSRGISAGMTLGVLLAMYLGNVVAQVEPDLGWLSMISAWGYFDTTATIDQGVIAWGDVGVFVAVAATCWGAAVALFVRRDLAG